MRSRRKINKKKYASLSIALLLLTFTMCNNAKEYVAISIVFLAVILNHWMLLTAVDELISSALSNEPANTRKIVFAFLLKAIILIGSITFSVHIMGNRIIIPILIYITQIFVLYFSLTEEQSKNQE